MWRATTMAIAMISMAGCVQLPPTTQDIQAKRFESVPGKAVIYIARPRVDAPNGGSIVIGNDGVITTYEGTYYRWEVPPGTQVIRGYGVFTASVTLQAEPGRIYFVQQTVNGNRRDGAQSMSLQQVSDVQGRRLVSDAQSL